MKPVPFEAVSQALLAEPLKLSGIMSASKDDIEWSKTTFDGCRREQLRRWRSLTVRERLEALDAMTELAERTEKQRLQATRGVREPPPKS